MLGEITMQFFAGMIALLILVAGQSGMNPLIVAITAEGPEMNSQVSPRFGQTHFLTIVDLHSDAKTVVRRDPRHNGYDLANELLHFKAEVVITGKIGPSALEVFRSAEVKVIQGVSGSVQGAISRFQSGQIE